jgi:ribosomal protein S1
MTGDENSFSDLKRVFGDYQSGDREEDWQTVVDELSEGQSVSGTVIARAHHGAYIDIGVGFPACLQIILMHGMDHEAYVANEWCPIGSEVTARILRIAGRQIALEQVPFEEVKESMRERIKAEP